LAIEIIPFSKKENFFEKGKWRDQTKEKMS
jgi:hypothetical protein